MGCEASGGADRLRRKGEPGGGDAMRQTPPLPSAQEDGDAYDVVTARSDVRDRTASHGAGGQTTPHSHFPLPPSVHAHASLALRDRATSLPSADLVVLLLLDT